MKWYLMNLFAFKYICRFKYKKHIHSDLNYIWRIAFLFISKLLKNYIQYIYIHAMKPGLEKSSMI